MTALHVDPAAKPQISSPDVFSRPSANGDPDLARPPQAPPGGAFGSSPSPSDGEHRSVAPVPFRLSPRERLRGFFKRHGRKLWWLHSTYALGLGATVVFFAQKGFEHARWLAVSVGAAWLGVVVLFRLFGSGAEQRIEKAAPKTRLRFLAVTYVLKNLYQGMLFFLLPFYWKSSSPTAPNFAFVGLLAACAVVSTLDIVFDRVVMRWRALASLFHAIALFGCLNLMIPALFPNTRTVWTLLCAAGVAIVGFWTLHVRSSTLKDWRWISLMLASVGLGVWGVYEARFAIPPVPMHLTSAAVGPQVLPDGRLAMEVRTLHASVIGQLIAVTDVTVPGGKGDRLHHVWRRDGHEIYRAPESTSHAQGPGGTIRLRSKLTSEKLPPHLAGSWTVDVETEDGQLVGRTAFTVVD
jgi:hypothetical protein